MKGKKFGRRGFLRGGAALVGGLAAGGIRPASAQETGTKLIQSTDIRPLGEVSRFERKIVRRGFNGGINDALTPHQDLHGIITPNELHYYVNHESGATPDIDPQEHRLLIHGMVDRPVELTMDEIKRLPSVSRICFVECNGNSSDIFNKNAKTAQEIHGRSSCAEWTGVPLSLLLKEVGVKRGGQIGCSLLQPTQAVTVTVYRWLKQWTMRSWPMGKMARLCGSKMDTRCGSSCPAGAEGST